MDLKEIISVSGQGGLFKYISQARNGVIAENIEDKKRCAISASAKVSALGEIAIYTDDEEVSLRKVFRSIYEKTNGGNAPDGKSDASVLKKFFESILPTYDRDRVYASDIKKVFNWYNILMKNNLSELFLKEEEEEPIEGEEKPIEVKE